MSEPLPVGYRPAELLAIYNRLLYQHGHHKRVPLSRPVVVLLEQLGQFLVERKINPERWIAAKHDAIHWKAAIPIRHLSRASDNFMRQFLDWHDTRLAEEQSQERLRSDRVQDVDPGREITSLSEAAKAALVLDPEVCMLSQQSFTMGWHPCSSWCSRCSLAQPCCDRLPPGVRRRRIRHARGEELGS